MRALLTLVLTSILAAQAPANRTVMGSIVALRPDAAELEVKSDTGQAIIVKVSSLTVTQRISPGQTDLTKAATISPTDLVNGDRVLITLTPDGGEARRIIAIPANDLAKRDAADKADWQARGVSGIVTAVNGKEVTVEARSLGGATKYTVSAGDKTLVKRYAPNSVRFSDAKPSVMTEIRTGDQLRARGAKSDDGLKLAAEEIVFGTFISRAGTITAVNSESRQVTIKDLANNKPLVVGFTADSRIRRMPEGGAGGGGAPMPAGPARGGSPSPAQPQTGPQAGPGRGAAATGPQKGPDIAQMLDALPPVNLQDLKVGEIIVLSAIEGTKGGNVTAVTLLANAEMLVQMAMAARGATGPAPTLAGLAANIGGVGP